MNTVHEVHAMSVQIVCSIQSDIGERDRVRVQTLLEGRSDTDTTYFREAVIVFSERLH